MKIHGIVSYNGTFYKGWQQQPNVSSIQQIIQDILNRICHDSFHIVGSGRTDAGVHAKKQSFHFEVKKNFDLGKLKYACNRLLPKDIHIVSFTYVDDDFHARFSAKCKHYSYTLFIGENDPFSNTFAYHFSRPMNIERYVEAIKLFEGTYSFINFTSKVDDEKNFVRNVKIETCISSNNVRVDFYGDGFMKYMIRFFIGTAIAYGENRIPLSYISERLECPLPRRTSKFKAPSEGLILEEVMY